MLEARIIKSNLSSKKRMLLTMEYLDKRKEEMLEFVDEDMNIPGIVTLEGKIISNYF